MRSCQSVYAGWGMEHRNVVIGTRVAPSRRLSWGLPASTCEGKMPSRQPIRCRRYKFLSAF